MAERYQSRLKFRNKPVIETITKYKVKPGKNICFKMSKAKEGNQVKNMLQKEVEGKNIQLVKKGFKNF